MKKITIIFLLCVSLYPVSVIGQPKKYRNITWEKFQSSGPELKQIGLLSVRKSNEIKSSTWSVGCETLDRDYAKFSVYKDYVGELGVKHGRLQSGWAKCEKQKGVYSFEWLDSCVYGLNEQSVKPWICLCYGNPLYGSGIGLGAGVAALSNNEAAMAGWLKYVEITVKRYKNVVNEWEVWNEPYDQEKDYAPLLMKTAELIKKIQPGAVILGEILWDPKEPGIKILLDALKAKNKLDLVDYWAYHPYVNNPDDCYPLVDKFVSILKSYNPKFKIYQGEVGCPSQLEWTHALAYYPWTEYSQAKWELRRMAGDRVRNIPSSVFTIIDLKYTNMLQSFGLIRSNLLHDIIYKRPSYFGVQHMVSFFDDDAIAMGEMPYESDSNRKMSVAGFKKGGKPVLLVWYNDRIPTDDLKWDPISITVKGVKFQDPVYVEMITGKVFEIDRSALKIIGENTSFIKLPVWDSPVMIAERSQVPMILKIE
jgi:polysaccharide biosynthesis protein PslG